MTPYLRRAHDRLPGIIELIRQLVACESAADTVDALVDRSKGWANAQRMKVEGFGDHLLLTFDLPLKSDGEAEPLPRVLGLGHSDTVWPQGTLAEMPYRVEGGRIWGPGVLDMKSGLAFWLEAVALLRECRVQVSRPVALLVVSDEEVGSPNSRSITEAEALRSGTVLVLEPGTGLSGKLKTSRKGVGRFRLTVDGIGAHAGVDFERGASAITELAHQVVAISRLLNLDRGITLNPGVVSGGSASNVVAQQASVDIDVRVRTAADAREVESALLSLKPVDSRCRLSWSGGLNRPPMERTPKMADLFARACNLAAEIGIVLEESATGGGSDGNFTAALGVPTLDGLGGVGEGAHARNESVVIDAIPERVALLALLLHRL